jgi:hypothetical protein
MMSQAQQNFFRNEPVVLDVDQVCHLRSIGLTWTMIAQLLGVSLSTLFRKRKLANIYLEVLSTLMMIDFFLY